MTSDPAFKTDSADLAAFLELRTGQCPEIVRNPGEQLAVFSFVQTPQLLELAAAFASGTATAPARQLLTARRRLFHRLKGGRT